MERSPLDNLEIFPSEEVLGSCLGPALGLWTSFFARVRTGHPDFREEWRYYLDGKSWLLKVTRKSRTVFWISVLENGFRATFYFSDRAEAEILDSGIPEPLKEAFTSGKHFGKIRGLTILFREPADIDTAAILIGIKLRY